MEKTQCGSKSNAHPGAGRSGKHKRKSGGGGKPIKVVYISNPMRVSTDASGFRALVQELTGRHADHSKYTGGGGGAVVDVGESSAGSPAGPQMGPAPSPGSTAESSDGAAAAAAASSHDVGAAAAATGYGYYDDEEEDSFPPQLIDNRYSVFSPPTFLYGAHNEL